MNIFILKMMPCIIFVRATLLVASKKAAWRTKKYINMKKRYVECMRSMYLNFDVDAASESMGLFSVRFHN
jgi:hypothetical protein